MDMNPEPDHSELPPDLTMSEFIEKLDNGKIQYRLKRDTDENAKDKFDLRGFTFNFDKDDSSTDEVLTFNNTLFENADLTKCEFNKCNFIGVYFEKCELFKTNFNNCTFTTSAFLDSNIVGSTFTKCVFKGQIIMNCDMTFSIFNGTSFIAGDNRSTSFVITNTDLFKTQLIDCLIQDGEIIQDGALSRDDGTIEPCSLVGSVFNNCKVERVKIESCELDSAIFNHTFLSECEFIQNSMQTVIFSDNSKISDCQFTDLIMDKLNLHSVEIESCYFENIELTYSLFTKTDIINSVFTSCNFTGLILTTPIQLLHCNFSLANFSNIQISKTIDDDDTIDVRESTFENAIFTDGVIPAEIFLNYDPDFTEADFNALFDQEKIEVDYEATPDFTYLSPLERLEIEKESEMEKESPLNIIVKLLTPNIKHVKLSISEMNESEWYGVSELGNTTLEEWKIISGIELDKIPNIGYVFKCISVPEQKEGEAVVYIANPPCMDVHVLSRQLNIPNIFDTFKLIGGNKSDDYSIEEISVMFAKLLYKLLSIHNADEGDDSWTNVFNKIEKRKVMINHAVFHSEEGIMFHPFFVESPNNLLYLISFIEKLPLQIQVAWAQNYMNEFITGYDQTLEDFDPTKRGVMGFIASCINGNFEKILFSIRTAIIQFYKTERPVEETAEEIRQAQIVSFTEGSLFQTYFRSLKEGEGPTIDGYKTFIETTLKDEEKIIFLSFFDEQTILENLNKTITQIGGKGRNRNKKRTIKKTKNKMKKRTIKKAKNNKKPNKKLNNKTVKRIKKNKK